MGLNLLLADFIGLLFFLLVLGIDALVLFRGDAQNLPQRRHDVLGGNLVVAAGAVAELMAAGSVNDNMVAGLNGQIAGIKEIDLIVGTEVNVHHRYGFRQRFSSLNFLGNGFHRNILFQNFRFFGREDFFVHLVLLYMENRETASQPQICPVPTLALQ